MLFRRWVYFLPVTWTLKQNEINLSQVINFLKANVRSNRKTTFKESYAFLLQSKILLTLQTSQCTAQYACSMSKIHIKDLTVVLNQLLLCSQDIPFFGF